MSQVLNLFHILVSPGQVPARQQLSLVAPHAAKLTWWRIDASVIGSGSKTTSPNQPNNHFEFSFAPCPILPGFSYSYSLN
jgi:hypothetical protein